MENARAEVVVEIVAEGFEVGAVSMMVAREEGVERERTVSVDETRMTR